MGTGAFTFGQNSGFHSEQSIDVILRVSTEFNSIDFTATKMSNAMIGMYNVLDSQQNSRWQTSLLDTGMVSPSFSIPTAIPSNSATMIASFCFGHRSAIAKHWTEARMDYHDTSDWANQVSRVGANPATMMVLGRDRSAKKAPLVAIQRYSAISIYRKALLFRSHH